MRQLDVLAPKGAYQPSHEACLAGARRSVQDNSFWWPVQRFAATRYITICAGELVGAAKPQTDGTEGFDRFTLVASELTAHGGDKCVHSLLARTDTITYNVGISKCVAFALHCLDGYFCVRADSVECACNGRLCCCITITVCLTALNLIKSTMLTHQLNNRLKVEDSTFRM